MAPDYYALKKELLQTRAAAERLELRTLAGRLQPGAARGHRLQRYLLLGARMRGNPLFIALAGALISRLPFGGALRLAAKAAALGWAGWQLIHVIQDFRGK
jgi:hypothetical protein